MISNNKEIEREFCKDLCNELLSVGGLPPEYPPWAKALALHMIRMGWKKVIDGK